MKIKGWHWGLAISLSFVVHAGAAVFLLPGEEEVQTAGGESGEISIFGDAFVDLLAAGAASETIEPLAEAEVAPVAPDSAQQVVEPVETAASMLPVPPEAPVAEQPDIAQPPETTAAEVPQPETSEPVQPYLAEADMADKEVIEPQEEMTAMVPIPTPRPNNTPRHEPQRAEAPAPARQQAAKAPPRQQAPRKAAKPTPARAGSGGRDAADARRGSTDGARAAAVEASRNATRSTRAGNAAVTNYPGKVVAKLRRALRYPRQAQRERLRGEVRVAFIVSSSGAVSSVRVVRSSGSPILDQAAIETVHRAAPFPAFPAGAGRSSWPFTVPLAFVR